MRSVPFLLIGFIAALALSIGVRAEEPRPSPQPKAPEGFAAIQEEAWLLLAREPGNHFQKAREAFVKKDLAAAADELRIAAVFLKIEAARASDLTRPALTNSARELDTLANSVQRGAVTSVETLDHTFARAQRALAIHHYVKAKDYWLNKDAAIAGAAIKAAAENVEQAIRWDGREVEEATGHAINAAKAAAATLKTEAEAEIKAASQDIEKVMQALEKEIEALERKLAPPGKEAPKEGTSTR